MSKRLLLGIIFFIMFLSTIPLAGYSLLHWGVCKVNSPCLIPVWFNPTIYAPSGVLFAGLAFVLRDLLQRCAGLHISILAIILGTVISYSYVSKEFAVAGGVAYFVSEICDTVIYTWLQCYNLILAIFISSCAGLVLDSVIFLHIAFNNYDYILGQLIGKMSMVVASVILIKFTRKYIYV